MYGRLRGSPSSGIALALICWPILFFSASVAGDAPASAPVEALVLTPAEAVDRALDAHPALLGERERVEEIRHRIREVYAVVWPQITGEASAARARDPGFLNTPGFDEYIANLPPDTEMDFFLPIPVTTYDYRISVEQLLYAFGKVGKAVEAARGTEKQIRFEILDRELRVARDAVLACYDLALAESRLDVLVAERASLERQVRQAADFLEIGTGTRLQYLQAKAALSALRPRELGAHADVKTSGVRLNEATGRDPLEPVKIVPDLLENALLPEIPTVRELVEASENRPDLAALAEQREVLDLRRQIEGANHRPEVRLDGSFGYRAIRSENLFDGDYESWDIGVYLDWNLFDGKRTRSRMRQIESQRLRSLWDTRSRRAMITRDLVSAVEGYRQAREAARAATEAIEQAREAHRVALEEHRWGAATMLQVLEAERTLTGSRFQRLDAVHTALGALAEIHYQVGRLPMQALVGEEGSR